MRLVKHGCTARSLRSEGVKQRPVSKLEGAQEFNVTCPQCGDEIGYYKGNGIFRCSQKHEFVVKV